MSWVLQRLPVNGNRELGLAYRPETPQKARNGWKTKSPGCGALRVRVVPAESLNVVARVTGTGSPIGCGDDSAYQMLPLRHHSHPRQARLGLDLHAVLCTAAGSERAGDRFRRRNSRNRQGIERDVGPMLDDAQSFGGLSTFLFSMGVMPWHDPTFSALQSETHSSTVLIARHRISTESPHAWGKLGSIKTAPSPGSRRPCVHVLVPIHSRLLVRPCSEDSGVHGKGTTKPPLTQVAELNRSKLDRGDHFPPGFEKKGRQDNSPDLRTVSRARTTSVEGQKP
ncbi:hypothetical protein DFH06DRAFT_1127883 [Mycena polygramma]|nr:hypothetical protein DFH06DRAFT_1127883 [Mycena polygramma]